MAVLDRDRWRVLQPLLDEALELSDEERASFLSRLRSSSPDLATDLTAFLSGEVDADRRGFLTEPLNAPWPDGRLHGVELGAYTLERPLGQGGMACVWLARRTDGRFEGRAAVKFLNLALLSPEGRQRFRREGSVLARFAHPGIARLLDAGVSQGGQPYLVLEYVDGQRIDDFADERGLSLDERIRLFLQVLAAVSHAHANLIVHRDLTPSNILVTADGTAKLLDFGLAKLLQPEAAVETPPARTAHRWMTPQYAAPEQVRGESVTTRTDVYQLGAVLYELVTGHAPFVASDLHELEGAVLTEDPVPPSVAVTRGHAAGPDAPNESGDCDNVTLARIRTGSRRAPRAGLSGALRGDLDAIVLKALRKEPEARFASVDALADDLRRHLSRHPVLARPQTVGYRLRRYARRHRVETLAVLGIAASLLGGAALSISHARRAEAERDRAEAASRESAAVTSFLLGLFEASDPAESQGDTLTARVLMQRGVARAEQLRGHPAAQARMLEVTGRVYQSLGQYAEAHALLERALAVRRSTGVADGPEVAGTLKYVADALLRLGRYAAADSAAAQALAIQERALGPENPAVAANLHQLAALAVYRGDLAAAETYHRRGLEVRERALGPEDSLTAASHLDLGATLRRRGRLAEAERELRRALAIYERVLRADHPDIGEALLHLAYLLDEEHGRYAEAEPLYRRALDIRRRAFGDGHPMVAYALSDLSGFLARGGDFAAAVPLARQSLEVVRRSYGPEHPVVATSIGIMANLLYAGGELKEAETLFRKGIALDRRMRGEDHPNVAGHEIGLARLLIDRGDYAGAEPVLRDAMRIRKRAIGREDPITAVAEGLLGVSLTRMGRYADADSVLRRAIQIMERTVTREQRDVRELYGWLAELHDAWGHPADAARYWAIAAAR